MSKKGDLEAFGGQKNRGNVVIELQHCTSSANFLIQRISGYLTKIFGFDTVRERGRASLSTVHAHELLFLNTTLPDEVFSCILAFWRTPRDYDEYDVDSDNDSDSESDDSDSEADDTDSEADDTDSGADGEPDSEADG